ncbi:AMP-binding protein [Endozoicomonas numazuensis]|uniref:Long-chain-fatty-acid--CoA ligase n=1 Tax=Endozoicomonas numazuensis TaxID=1137799 RepID=A0A081NEY5_9GAMM|nr:AMP-binding protein [Endozoicomonas numazuensis]KEQ17008.1 long-chain fatty acid--CoA ligase [Endozoicomonas numazuensis]
MEVAFWDGKRAPGISDHIDLRAFCNLGDVIADAVERHGDKPAFTGLGLTLSFKEVDRLSDQFAAYLQHHTGLQPGDRIALQMPNILQYPVVAFGAIKAGLVIVNTNPLYTAREIKHQFNDSGVKALVCVNIVGHLIEEVLPETGVEHLIVTDLADLLPWPKRSLLNFAIKHVKKMVPAYSLPKAISFRQAMAQGSKETYKPPKPAKREDLAALQYTGGTTGVAKGAMLTHENLVSNVLQTAELRRQINADGSPVSNSEGDIVVAPLPLYHIYAFTVHLLSYFSLGGHSIFIANPRDIDTFIKTIKPWRINTFIGLNTLFVGLMNHPEFKNIDFSDLRVTNSGGTALQQATADRWFELTGCRIGEGYGLSETSPVLTANPAGDYVQDGSVGIAVPGTALKVIDDEGNELPFGEAGELCAKGPQVMAGYWQRPEATAEVLDDEGWFRTGDIAIIQEDGYVRIVDRLKDMVLVSGFNVYPNEIEGVVTQHDKVLNCAAIGVPDEKTGEAVKLFVIPQDESITEQELKDYCRKNMTAYKVPSQVEFREELPMTPVGKVLRKDLRAEELKKLESV